MNANHRKFYANSHTMPEAPVQPDPLSISLAEVVNHGKQALFRAQASLSASTRMVQTYAILCGDWRLVHTLLEKDRKKGEMHETS
ncbi:MAG: hypothetical protein KZQ99_09210 [Candidatus Thiodiazotropha sp. (ex Dulcina madagascariensis)]|nr:hypothetical protein [Candidatus Thiodiazotropha sp. (ex Dulcina madagascariensis)]